ncbi:MAG TPA: hypothetical protein VFH11_04260 [Gemmatimonadota bacterium]|nr:hypothetical protein [Gemmatimonadota bacterium]
MSTPPEKAKSERPSQLSRNVAFASAIVIALLVGYLTLEAFRDGAPAAITFEVVAEDGWTQGSSAYVPIDVRNTGGRTAAAIEVETKFEVADADPIVTRTIIDFLAGGELRRIYAVGPIGSLPSVRLVGFQEP